MLVVESAYFLINMKIIIDQRSRNRRASIPFFCLYHVGIKKGRRINKRRSGAGAAYVDSYAPHLVLCTIAIVLLSAMDALLTLNILARGGTELNIFMTILMEDSTEKFVHFKLALTSLALIFLIIHHNHQLIAKLQVRHLLYLILFGYLTLIGYEVALLTISSS
ncbi:hypothetical protein SAMN05421882_102024 [Nitrosomonas communis]|uniref:DUF5658 domain-containing protein n=2 Tax=Nitrosomonas communis TaxID=44574 RepID=A0A1H2V8S4_9PROT|nr:hypothetical protein SAMN05421882_102024 [Nitrosomonas communis]